ncbi:ankyrin repeat domain-containing protein [Aspergillus stella-maris]|uniref:ankyrin repeat domain-containing protein n=1 Tax=Aspergillus stella-maris TaxID=1810926 RepID=UPI003CCD47B6
MPYRHLLRLPTELLLMITEQLSPSDLAAFVLTSRKPRILGLPLLKSTPLYNILKDFMSATDDDNHQAILLLLSLIRQKAKVHDWLGYKALTLVCNSTCRKAVRALRSDGHPHDIYDGVGARLGLPREGEPSPVLSAMMNHDTAALETLLEMGFKWNDLIRYSCGAQRRYSPDYSPEYRLHHAVLAHFPAAVKLLISLASAGNEDIVRLLLQHGADPKFADSMGYTPLLIATVGLNLEVMKVLLEHGVMVNHRDNKGWSALSHATRFNDDRFARLLVEYGAKVNQVDALHRTPLFHAIERGCTSVIKLLLQVGADPLLLDSKGKCARDYAEASSYRSTLCKWFGLDP